MLTQRVQNAMRLFSTIPYFKELDEQTLQTLVANAVLRQYDAGQLVILEGEPSVGLYIIEDGWLKVSKIARDGREQTLQFLGRGEAFNAIGVFTDQPNPATLTALEPARIWLVYREAVLNLLDTHPPLARLVIQDLAGRVLHLLELVEDLSLRTVEARVARLLLQHSIAGQVSRRRWATQNEMASRLGTVPDVIGRTLRRLSEQGLIQVSRNDIQILDRGGLEIIAAIEIDDQADRETGSP